MEFLEGLTKVKMRDGNIGTVIMNHGNGEVNVCLPNGEYRLNVKVGELKITEQLLPVQEGTAEEPKKKSIWTKMKFWGK